MLALLGLAGASLSAQTPPPSGVAEVNGTRLYYETAGSGRNLVLIHGGAVDSRAWDDQFRAFARRHRVIRYDLRGAGRSGDRDKPFSNSEDLYALLRHLRVERTYLAGISRGGGIAFDFTLEHPEMVEGLVLVSSNLSAGVPAYEAMFERATEAGRKSGAAAAAAVWGYDPFQGPRRDAARARVLEILKDNMPRFRYFDGYEPVRQLTSSLVPRADRLKEIRVPTLVICGAHDNPVARANYNRWAGGIPGARLVVFPESAHLVNVDQPEEFNRTVLDFLHGLNEQ
jgi:pimeloyl-ACP methyl ester carboxylesterase